MRACDEATFRELGVPSFAVMESAGRTAAYFAEEYFTLDDGIAVVAGGGNNGGDGYVCARALANLGHRAVVLALKPIEELQGDARLAAEAWLKSGGSIMPVTEGFLSAPACEETLKGSSLLIDAIYGTGFRDEVTGIPLKMITLMNALHDSEAKKVLAIDIPSGVHADTGDVRGIAVRATSTLALQFLKLGHVMFPGAEYAGEVVVADVGIWSGNPSLAAIRRELLLEEEIGERVRRFMPVSKETHKGSRGHVTVVGGSTGHYGAPLLSARAALRTGAGLTTVALPKIIADHLTPHLNELMALPIGRDDESFDADAFDRFVYERLKESKASFVLGPGLGQSKRAEQIVELVLQRAKDFRIPIVIDADGLNVVSKRRDLRRFITSSCVLTPHPGEMARLVGLSTQEVQRHRPKMAATLSQELCCAVVLKGARTIIAGPSGEVCINPAASPTLATAGAGDVLAGIVGALLAQGFPAMDAACVGVYAHGISGETARPEGTESLTDPSPVLGPMPIIASDIISRVPQTMCRLYGTKWSPASVFQKVFSV